MARILTFLLLLGLTSSQAKPPAYPQLEARKASPGQTSYFVDPTKGDDQNPGTTKAKPWRSFHPLNQLRLAPGDTVHLAPGTFDHSLVLSGSGAPDHPVKIKFAPGTYHFHPTNAYREAYQISNTNAAPDTPKAVAILLRHAKHFQITGKDALALYRGKMMEVCLDRCENITISGLSFDYHRPTVSEWQVTAITHDDAINIHGTHLKITEALSQTEIKVRFMHKQSFGFPAFNPGDDVDFVARETLATYGRNQIKTAKLISPREMILVLAKPLPPEFQLNDALENVTWTPAVEIRNCKVERTPTRGFLITTRRKSVIADNEFHATHMSAILIENDASGWYESGCVRDLTIRKNRFFRCRPPVIQIDPKNKKSNPAVHRNIRIDRNTFHLTGVPLLASKSTSKLSFTNNLIFTKETLSQEQIIKTHDAPPATVTGNQFRIVE